MLRSLNEFGSFPSFASARSLSMVRKLCDSGLQSISHLTGAVDSRQQQCDQWEAFARFLLLTVLCPLRVEAGLGLARIQERLDEHSVSNLDSDPYSEDYRQVTLDRHFRKQHGLNLRTAFLNRKLPFACLPPRTESQLNKSIFKPGDIFSSVFKWEVFGWRVAILFELLAKPGSFRIQVASHRRGSEME